MTDTETKDRPPLKVAILGTAPASRMMAPFTDPSWEIWACSQANMGVLPRVNAWFEMHDVQVMMSDKHRAMATGFYAWLKAQSDAGAFSVIMLQPNDFVPKAVPYPRDDMVALFGRNWFTSTVAYMLAMAIARKASKITLFGVDMAAQQEHYEAQRAGCTHFIEVALANGIEVEAPWESSILAPTPMYGYSEATPFGRRVTGMKDIVDAGVVNAAAQEQAARDNRHYFSGAQEQLRYFERTWTDGTELDIDMSKLKAVLDAGAPHPEKAAAPPQPVQDGQERQTLAKVPPVSSGFLGELHGESAHGSEFPLKNGHMVPAASEGG